MWGGRPGSYSTEVRFKVLNLIGWVKFIRVGLGLIEGVVMATAHMRI